MKSNTDMKADIQKLLDESEIFTCYDVTDVNHKPHPFVIGPRHVAWASDNYGGMLGEEAILNAERAGITCSHPQCRIPYHEHTSDKVCALQLKRDASETEAHNDLNLLVDYCTENDIDGLVFIDTEEKFKIT